MILDDWKLAKSKVPTRGGGLSVRFEVGRLGFDSLVASDQKTLKVGIRSLPAWHSALKRQCEDKRDYLYIF